MTRSFHRLSWLLRLVVAVVAVVSSCERAVGQARSEYELKAVFFVTLARYTQWPANAVGESFRIGILGSDPFGEHINALVANENVQGRPIKLVRCGSVEEALTCQMVFFGEMTPVRMELAVARLRPRPILTVSDSRVFIQGGGMIELFLNEERRVRLRIAKAKVESAGLVLSPSLLKLGQTVAFDSSGSILQLNEGALESLLVPPATCALPVALRRYAFE